MFLDGLGALWSSLETVMSSLASRGQMAACCTETHLPRLVWSIPCREVLNDKCVFLGTVSEASLAGMHRELYTHTHEMRKSPVQVDITPCGFVP